MVLACALAACATAGGEADSGAAPQDGSPAVDDAAVTPDGCGDASCGRPPCTGTPWGTVADGFTGTAYEAREPSGPCVSETRTCTAGAMTGTYTATTCTPGCTGTPWGDVPTGFSGVAYAVPHPATGAPPCVELAETRTCSAGVMSGSHTELSCTNYACEHAGARVQYRAWVVDDPDPALSSWRECQLDGTWGPATPGSPFPASPLCAFEGAWFPRFTCGFYEGAVYVCSPPDWLLVDSPGGCPDGP